MAHVTTSVCAKSGELTKSYSSLGSLVRSFFSVTFVSWPAGCFEKTVFTPSKENMCRTTESPCLEFSLNPSSSMVASGSLLNATISYQYEAALQSLSMLYGPTLYCPGFTLMASMSVHSAFAPYSRIMQRVRSM